MSDGPKRSEVVSQIKTALDNKNTAGFLFFSLRKEEEGYSTARAGFLGHDTPEETAEVFPAGTDLASLVAEFVCMMYEVILEMRGGKRDV